MRFASALVVAAALLLAAPARADVFSEFSIWDTAVLREHYHHVYRAISSPENWGPVIFRNLAVATGNHTDNTMGISWAYDYANRLSFSAVDFTKTARYLIEPLNARDDIYPSMKNVSIELTVTPLSPVIEEPRSMVTIGATIDCGDPSTCHKLNSIWTDEIAFIADNLRFYFGAPCSGDNVYTVSGACNNLARHKYTLGGAFTIQPRLGGILYPDGISAPNGENRPNPRVISNAIVHQNASIPNSHNLNALLVLWGQLVDHELVFFQELHPGDETLHIPVPKGDPDLDPNSLGNVTIKFTRSQAVRFSGTSRRNPREILNTITAFIDGSFVYGSSEPRHSSLREFSGGRLLTSSGDFLPHNVARMPNADAFIAVPIQARPTLPIGRFANASFFLAGDFRANENVHLAAMHTLLVREHNRIANKIAAAVAPFNWTDQEIFDQARRVLASEMQYVTLEQFATALLGKSLPAYQGYDVNVDPSVDLAFSTAFFRLGHTLFPETIPRLDANLKSIPEGPLDLKTSFFAPHRLVTEGGMDPVFRGMLVQHAEEIDTKIVDGLRSFLFGPPGTGLGGSDLSCLNIQRGRDHALPDLNGAREALGLPRHQNFTSITSDPVLADKLKQLYGDVNNIDLWIGMLAEDHVTGAPVGETLQAGVTRQFVAIRDGDRLYYRNAPLPAIIRQAMGTDLDFIDGAKPDVLARIISHNTGVNTTALPILNSFVTASNDF